MKLAKNVVIGTIILTIIATALITVLPLPSATDTWAFRSETALAMALTLMYAGTAILFLISLRSYKSQTRRAFIILAAGILLTAIATMQLPIIQAFGLDGSFWVKSGIIVVPFLLGVLVVHIGIRSFARLVGIRTILTNVSVVVAIALALSVVSSLLPHSSVAQSELQLDISNAIVVWVGLFYLVSALIVMQIKQRIGAHYVNAMAWLYIALVGSVFVALSALADGLFTNAGTGGDFLSVLTSVLTFAVGVVYMRAGYAFTQAEDY